MTTRAEQFRATQERRGPSKAAKRASGSKPGLAPRDRSRDKPHAAKKATYALELTSGRPSRKSTRKSANRSKPDAAFNLREQLTRGSPEERFRKSRVRSRTA